MKNQKLKHIVKKILETKIISLFLFLCRKFSYVEKMKKKPKNKDFYSNFFLHNFFDKIVVNVNINLYKKWRITVYKKWNII